MEFEVPKFCYRRPKQNEYCNNPQVNKYLSIYRNAIPQPKKIYFLCSRHPVHIVGEDNQLSPSAFIPFCEFGGNMSAMATKINQFDMPVCSSFKPKILNDQLCYETYSLKGSEQDLKRGLILLLDYNEDRQVSSESQSVKEENNLYAKFIKTKKEDKTMINLNTIGK